MQIDDPSALKERIGQRSALRARFPARPHPGPAAMRMLRLLATIFRTQARWRAVVLVVAVIVTTLVLALLAVRLASWNADFFDAIEQKSWTGLARQSWLFLGIVAATAAAQGAALQAKRKLQLTLRTHLTEVMIEAWMVEGREARLQELRQDSANEDGRIAEDGRVVCEMVVDFLASLLYAVLQFVLFVGVLWLTSGPLRITLGGIALLVPGHMVWISLAYAGLAAAITVWIGHPLVRATNRRQGAEAVFRAGLVHAAAHAGAIAMARAEADERRRLTQGFAHVRGTWAEQTISFRRMVFLSSGFALLTAALPMLLLAPRHFAGEMSLGTLIQVTIAFGQVTAALFWMSDNYPAIAQWEASAERVLGLHEAVGDLGVAAGAARPGEVERSDGNGDGLDFRDLSLVSPSGELLVSGFSAEIAPGERVLIEATPQAAAALFRAMAGLSPWGSGRIALPEGAVPYFAGERPYLAEATLADVLAEPRRPEAASPAEIAAILVHTGLAHLIPALATTAPWEQELGLEDQQRLGIARVMLHRPAWLFMHDPLSALDAAEEERLMTALFAALPETAIVTITHRPAVTRLHERRITLARG